MGKYKFSDIAASLPKPKKAVSESGKKLQALFNQFYDKRKTNDATDDTQIRRKSPKALAESKLAIKKPKSNEEKKRKFFTEENNDGSLNAAANIKCYKKSFHKFSSTSDPEYSPKKKKLKKSQESSAVDSSTPLTTESASKDSVFIKQNKSNFKPRSFPQEKKNNTSREFHSNAKFKPFNKNNSSNSEHITKKKKFKRNQESTTVDYSTSLTTESVGKDSVFRKQNKSNFKPRSFPQEKKYNTSPEFHSNAKFKPFNKNNASNSEYVPKKKKFKRNQESTTTDSDKSLTTESASKGSMFIKQNKSNFEHRSFPLEKKHNFSSEFHSNANFKSFNDCNASNSSKSSFGNTEKVAQKQNESNCEPLPFPRTKKQKSDTTEKATKTEKEKYRTVFVGNLPKTTTKKELKRLFKPYGSIATLRLRGIIPQKEGVSKKIAGISGKYHKKLQSIQAYVVFAETESVKKALVLNGSVFNKRHIFVDPVTNATEKDNKRTIFLGNLPYDVDEEEIWDAFNNCGRIDKVRIVKDKDIGAGKGFGYVMFDSTQAKEEALSMKDVEIRGRTIRIQAAGANQRNNKKERPNCFKKYALKMKKEKLAKFNHSKSSTKIMKAEKRKAQKKHLAKLFADV